MSRQLSQLYNGAMHGPTPTTIPGGLGHINGSSVDDACNKIKVALLSLMCLEDRKFCPVPMLPCRRQRPAVSMTKPNKNSGSI